MGGSIPAERAVRYPRRAEITRLVQAARATGVNVGSIDVRPDGSIRINTDSGAIERPDTEFDRWDKAGRL